MHIFHLFFLLDYFMDSVPFALQYPNTTDSIFALCVQFLALKKVSLIDNCARLLVQCTFMLSPTKRALWRGESPGSCALSSIKSSPLIPFTAFFFFLSCVDFFHSLFLVHCVSYSSQYTVYPTPHYNSELIFLNYFGSQYVCGGFMLVHNKSTLFSQLVGDLEQ